jgi:integrating conjugative element protein (TIGR03757 family)
MRTSIHSLLRGPALLILLATGITAAGAAEVLVITDARHPVAGTERADRVIALDAAQRIEAELSAQLPADPQRAAALIQQRLEQGGPALQQRLREAYQGVTDAWSLSITTVPAVVVDQRYVVYGEADLDKALADVERYRKERP